MLKTILILDDQPESLRVFGWVLESRHFRVITTEDVETAVGHCSAGPIDLLISDVQLRSKLSGTDAAQLVHDSCPDIPILFSSGTPLEDWPAHDFDKLRALAACRVDFLPKPFSIEALMIKVESLMGASGPLPGFLDSLDRAEKHRRMWKPREFSADTAT
jgi:DNA-binding response OmpR family regulator